MTCNVIDLAEERAKRERAQRSLLRSLVCRRCGERQIGIVVSAGNAIRYPRCFACGRMSTVAVDLDFELDVRELAHLEAGV